MKVCSKCGEEKSLAEFEIRSDTKKPRGQCKVCRAIYMKEYEKKNAKRVSSRKKKFRKENAEHVRAKEKEQRTKHKNRIIDYNKKYNEKNKERQAEYRKEYNRKNKEKIAEKRKAEYPKRRDERLKQQRLYYKLNNDKIRTHRRRRHAERMKSDILYRLKHLIRARLSCAISNNSKSGKTLDLLGCSIDRLKEYLELQFNTRMSWDNHGLYGWHIDHIKPLDSFDLTKKSELIKACHYTNLQPLWAKDNLIKGSKISKEFNNAD